MGRPDRGSSSPPRPFPLGRVASLGQHIPRGVAMYHLIYIYLYRDKGSRSVGGEKVPRPLRILCTGMGQNGLFHVAHRVRPAPQRNGPPNPSAPAVLALGADALAAVLEGVCASSSTGVAVRGGLRARVRLRDAGAGVGEF